MDRLTKFAHFILVKDNTSSNNNVRKIVRLHGVPKTIMSDRDMRFVLVF